MDIPFAVLLRIVPRCFSYASCVGLFISGLEDNNFDLQSRAFRRCFYRFCSWSLGAFPMYLWHDLPCPRGIGIGWYMFLASRTLMFDQHRV
jgi:hypothetical protein